MNDETLKALIETVQRQTKTLKEMMEICTTLKDRVEALEGYVNCKPLSAAPFDN